MSLTLFTNITEELTPLERNTLVPMLIDTLANSNEGNRFKGKWICNWFRSSGQPVTEPRLRKMINYIRVMNVQKGLHRELGNKVVIGASNGYFVTGNEAIIRDQIESLEGRMDSMAAVVDSLKAQLENLKQKKK
jgi:hypothetical protein